MEDHRRSSTIMSNPLKNENQLEYDSGSLESLFRYFLWNFWRKNAILKGYK